MKAMVAVVVVLAVGASACGSAGTATSRVFSVEGVVHAGPTCPVVREPPDPACADQPVAGAELVVLDASGREVIRVRTDAEGRFQAELPAGRYMLAPQPVAGLLGTPAPIDFTVPAEQPLDVAYDTGIR